MFANRNQQIVFEPKDGDHLIVNGTLSIFEGRGQYQLIVEHVELAGEGALLRAFEDLKKKLYEEGHFDDSIKKNLPFYPKNIAIITSPDGAVIKDIINVIGRRSPFLNLIVVPTLVQGEKASQMICEAIKKCLKLKELDLIILARGGGSIEDLWAFNTEQVARAIINCPLPIISAIGHETDFTISDFVSDLRAPTPSIAAELVSQLYSELDETLDAYLKNLKKSFESYLEYQEVNFNNLKKRIRHPGDKLREKGQKVDYLETSLIQNIHHEISAYQHNLKLATQALEQNSPAHKLKEKRVYLKNVSKDLFNAFKVLSERKNKLLIELSSTLQAVSPLSVLARGYSIISTESDGKVLSSADQVEVGQEISAILSKGKIKAEVKSKKLNEN